MALLKRPDFDPADIDTDLHKRVAGAIKDGFIKRFDMHVNSRDGDQDLSMWMRDVEVVVRGIMRDEPFKGNQNFCFEACLQDRRSRRRSRRGWPQGEHVRDQPVAVAVWAREASHWGPVRV